MSLFSTIEKDKECPIEILNQLIKTVCLDNNLNSPYSWVISRSRKGIYFANFKDAAWFATEILKLGYKIPKSKIVNDRIFFELGI